MPPRFSVAQRVRVKDWTPPGHIRTPSFVRGHVGTIQEVAGTFKNPEELAYGRRDAAKLTLYRVMFEQAELWPDNPSGETHSIVLDLFENWLEPAEQTQ
ncbi:MAG: SH3-like domain-containing protein [Methyloligellaceae bacterium]